MNTVVWALQIVFGVLFFLHGIALVVKPAAIRAQLGELPYSSGFLAFIGVCESLGGLGLILPGWTGIMPWLTPLAAAGLAIIMAGAAWTHLSHKQASQVGVTALITLLLVLSPTRAGRCLDEQITPRRRFSKFLVGCALLVGCITPKRQKGVMYVNH